MQFRFKDKERPASYTCNCAGALQVSRRLTVTISRVSLILYLSFCQGDKVSEISFEKWIKICNAVCQELCFETSGFFNCSFRKYEKSYFLWLLLYSKFPTNFWFLFRINLFDFSSRLRFS